MRAPLLAKWHPMLLDYESTRPPGVSPVAHERAWDKNVELRGILAEVRESLVAYANILASVVSPTTPLCAVGLLTRRASPVFAATDATFSRGGSGDPPRKDSSGVVG